jgi:hypothetical protein
MRIPVIGAFPDSLEVCAFEKGFKLASVSDSSQTGVKPLPSGKVSSSSGDMSSFLRLGEFSPSRDGDGFHRTRGLVPESCSRLDGVDIIDGGEDKDLRGVVIIEEDEKDGLWGDLQ